MRGRRAWFLDKRGLVPTGPWANRTGVLYSVHLMMEVGTVTELTQPRVYWTSLANTMSGRIWCCVGSHSLKCTQLAWSPCEWLYFPRDDNHISRDLLVVWESNGYSYSVSLPQHSTRYSYSSFNSVTYVSRNLCSSYLHNIHWIFG